jgi:hypothetical protein
MRMPGFEAEASLFLGSQYRTVSSGHDMQSVQSMVEPALRCRDCADICDGDIVGECLPWCFCACRGGKHCPLPS